MFIRQDDCAIPTFKCGCGERVSLIVCTLGIILIGLASCIYTYLVGVSEAVSDIFTMI